MAEEIKLNIDITADGAFKSLRTMREELKQLTMGAEQASAGFDVLDKNGKKMNFDQLVQKAANLKNEMREFNQQLRSQAPEMFLSNMIKMSNGVIGAYSSISGAMNMMFGDNKKLQEIQAKSVALIQLMMGLEQARQLFESQGMMLAFTNQVKLYGQKLANILATKAEVVATGEMVIAQTALNRVMMNNPVALLITAVAALAVGISYLAMKYKEYNAVADAKNKVDEKAFELSQDSTAEYVLLTQRMEQGKLTTNELYETQEKLMKQFPVATKGWKDVKVSQEELYNFIKEKAIPILLLQAKVQAAQEFLKDEWKKSMKDRKDQQEEVAKITTTSITGIIKNIALGTYQLQNLRAASQDTGKEFKDISGVIAEGITKDLAEIEKLGGGKGVKEKDTKKEYEKQKEYELSLLKLNEESRQNDIDIRQKQFEKETVLLDKRSTAYKTAYNTLGSDLYKINDKWDKKEEKLKNEQEETDKKVKDNEIKLQNEIFKNQIESAKAAKDEVLVIELEKRQEIYNLNTQGLGEEEYLKLLASIEQKYANKSIALAEDTAKKKAEQRQKDGKKEEDDEKKKAELQKRKNQEIIRDVSEGFQALNNLFNTISEGRIQMLSNEQKASDEKFENDTMNMDQNSQQYKDMKAQHEATDKEFEEKRKAEEKKARVRQAEMDIVQIGIKTALAIMTYAGTLPLAGPIIAGALGAFEMAAAIANLTKIQSMGQGGVLQGKSHAEGGIPMVAEGGEAIINKRSTSMFAPMLSALNVAGGGKSFAPSMGTIKPTTSSMMSAKLNSSDLQAIINGVASIPVIVSERDISNTQRKVSVNTKKSIV